MPEVRRSATKIPGAVNPCRLAGHHQAAAILHEAVAQVAPDSLQRPLYSDGADRVYTIAAGAVGLDGEQQATEIPLSALLAFGRS